MSEQRALTLAELGQLVRTPEELAIFNAALSGICANPAFFGSIMQQSPEAAVRFAASVVAVTKGERYE